MGRLQALVQPPASPVIRYKQPADGRIGIGEDRSGLRIVKMDYHDGTPTGRRVVVLGLTTEPEPTRGLMSLPYTV